MNSAELEAQADKTAFPWSCVMCTKEFHYKDAQNTSMGRVCCDCCQIVKQKAYDQSERVFKQ